MELFGGGPSVFCFVAKYSKRMHLTLASSRILNWEMSELSRVMARPLPTKNQGALV